MAQKRRSILVHMFKEHVKRVHIVKNDSTRIELVDCDVYHALHFIEIHTKDKLLVIPMTEINYISTQY